MLLKTRIRLPQALALIVIAIILVFAPSITAQTKWGRNYFPNTALTTQDGKKVHFYDDLIKGKIVAIDFIYTSCQYSCPLSTARLAQVQRMLGDRVGKDIFFYSISIDPKHDTPAVLTAYAKKFHAGPGWTFLTGKKADIDFLSQKLGMYADPNINKDGHEAYLLIGNANTGQWLRDMATDNPHFVANLIGNFMDNWKHEKVVAQTAPASPPAFEHNTGKYLFNKQCGACHTVGQGDKIGPDLNGVTNIRSYAWLMRYIAQPDKVLAANDPIALALAAKYKMPMPNLRLGDLEISTILNYIKAASSDKNRIAENPKNANAHGPKSVRR